MRDSVPSARYSSVCNVLRQWRIWLIPTYRVYRLYDTVLGSTLYAALGILVTGSYKIMSMGHGMLGAKYLFVCMTVIPIVNSIVIIELVDTISRDKRDAP